MFRYANAREGKAGTVLLTLLIIAAAGGGAWYFIIRSTPENSVAMMLEAARVNDQEKMNARLTARSRNDESLVIALSRALAGTSEDEPTYTVGEAEITDDRATVPVTFPLSGTAAVVIGRDTVTVPFVLHREGMTWLVDSEDTGGELRSEIAGSTLDLIERFLSR